MTRVVCIVSDMIFASRIRAAAAAAGLTVEFARDAASPAVRDAHRVIVDLECAAVDPIACVRAIKQLDPAPLVVAYGPHVRGELLEAAHAAGADVVVPRSKFSARLTDMLTGAPPVAPGSGSNSDQTPS